MEEDKSKWGAKQQIVAKKIIKIGEYKVEVRIIQTMQYHKLGTYSKPMPRARFVK